MITAIAIPLLFLYFYYVTRKERKQFYNKWLQIGKVAEESFVKGTIVDIREKTERYYYHYSIYIIDLLLQHENEKIAARIQFPMTDSLQKPSFQIGETIICYGQWKNRLFLFATYQTASTVSENLVYNIDQRHRRQGE